MPNAIVCHPEVAKALREAFPGLDVQETERIWPDCLFEQRRIWSLCEYEEERWPYGPPGFHEPCCLLHERPGYCDCKASDSEDVLWGAN